MTDALQRVEAGPVAATRTELLTAAAAAVLGALMAGEKTVPTFAGYTFAADMMLPSYAPDTVSDVPEPAAPVQG